MFIDQLCRSVHGRSRIVMQPLVLAGAAVLALASAGSVTAASAALAAPASISFFTGGAPFHASGHKWFLTVNITLKRA
jgi:hypothetical protein